MNDNWIVAKASVIGASHIKENLPCQDSHGYKFFIEDNFGIAVVSDGAGSKDFSHLGSSKIVQHVIEKFSKVILDEKFHLSAPEPSVWNERSVEVFQAIFQSLKEFAEFEKINFESLAATAIVVVIMPYGLLTTHIGDGRAGYLNDRGEWLSCIKPYKGELANETVFITSDFWTRENFQRFIESRVIQDTVLAFTLLSDGCENVCFELNKFNDATNLYERKNNPYSGFYNHNVEVLKTLQNNGLTESEIDFMWERFLTNGLESFTNETDDKTLLLGIKIKNYSEPIDNRTNAK